MTTTETKPKTSGMKLNKDYWQNRYLNDDAAWDAGAITTPLKAYFDQIENKKLKILLPGAGNAHEFDYLIQQGFEYVFVLDFARQPLENINNRHAFAFDRHLIEADFFEHEGYYDLIVEQTFFCALEPRLREEYVAKMASLLKPGGKLAGLLFRFPLTEKGPPFGGSEAEYVSLFEKEFYINVLETAHNSIKPRQGNELFFIFTKKQP